eukprot:SAG11_NODE_2120_length_3790_cov_6.378759_6_plen_77_part_00
MMQSDETAQFDFPAVVRPGLEQDLVLRKRRRTSAAATMQYVGPGDAIGADPDILRSVGVFVSRRCIQQLKSSVLEP